MLYTRIGQVLAFLMIALGTVLVGTVVFTGLDPWTAADAITGEPVVVFDTSKALVDGIKYILIGTTIGVLTDISVSVKQGARSS